MEFGGIYVNVWPYWYCVPICDAQSMLNFVGRMQFLQNEKKEEEIILWQRHDFDIRRRRKYAINEFRIDCEIISTNENKRKKNVNLATTVPFGVVAVAAEESEIVCTLCGRKEKKASEVFFLLAFLTMYLKVCFCSFIR